MEPATNPFGTPSPSLTPATNPFAPKASSPFAPAPSPFGQPSAIANSATSSATANPFASAPAPKLFGSNTGTQSPFGANTVPSDKAPQPFGQATAQVGFVKAPAGPSVFGQASGGTPAFGASSQHSSPFGAPGTSSNNGPRFGGQQSSSIAPFGGATNAVNGVSQSGLPKAGTQLGGSVADKKQKTQMNGSHPERAAWDTFKPKRDGGAIAPGAGLKRSRVATSEWRPQQRTRVTNRTQQLSSRAKEYADAINEQLAQDGITAPQWPANPGDPQQGAALDKFKESYKKYRQRTYASLRKADLIDDPDKRKRLEDALDFKGICEDMCPEFEQVTRITEFDVKSEEKEVAPDGVSMWPAPARMVKKHYRSAAGQDAPLPMDVRSVDALRRTTDYLFDDLLGSDDNLPSMHNFLWDRTRAIRKDFGLHSTRTPEEIKEQIYCFEAIARFHVTALHLLSRKGFAADDFDQKQEVEQLGNTLLSLIQIYDDCQEKDIVCQNEAEFRAYFVVLNAHDQFIERRIQEWEGRNWFDEDIIQTALSLVHNMSSVREKKGPLKPYTAATLTGGASGNFFAIVEDPKVSYTMGCFAEIHFTWVRQLILEAIVRSYARQRDAPKSMTARALNEFLRFDTDEEAVDFAKLHDLSFSTEGSSEEYLLLNSRRQIPRPRVPQSFSKLLVERKRGSRSLPEVIHTTTFEDPSAAPAAEAQSSDDMFVDQTDVQTTPSAGPTTASPGSSLTPQQAQPPANAPVTPTLANNNWFMNGFKDHGNAGKMAQAPVAPTDDTKQIEFAKAVQAPFQSVLPPATKSSTPFSSFQDSPAPASNLSGAPKAPGQQETSVTASTTKASPFAGFQFSSSTTPPSAMTPSQSAHRSRSANPFQTGIDEESQGVSPTSTAGAAGIAASPFFLTTSAPTSTPKPQQAPMAASLAAGMGLQSAPSGKTATPALNNSQPPKSTMSTPAVSAKTSAPQALNQPPSTGPKVQSASAVTLPTPKPDLMARFTEWFVNGDQGVLENFRELVLNDILTNVWSRHQEEARERKRREEDAQSWADATRFKQYNLGIKYFYRWRHIAREHALRRRQQELRDQQRQYLEEKARREARARIKEERAKKHRREDFVSGLMPEAGPSRNTSRENVKTDDALRHSGIFSGMRDADEVARRVADGSSSAAYGHYRERRLSAASTASISDVRHQYLYGLAPTATSAASTARAAGRERPDASSPSPGGRKTQQLRERYGSEEAKRRHRASTLSSSGYLSGSVTNFSHSMPAALGAKHADGSASRKRHSGEDISPRDSLLGRKKTVMRTPYWDMRARGMVQMPGGEWLHESVARHRPAGLGGRNDRITGDMSPPASVAWGRPRGTPSVYSRSRSNSADTEAGGLVPSIRELLSRHGASPGRSPDADQSGAGKRKRGAPSAVQDDEDDDDEDLDERRSVTSQKRARPSRSSAAAMAQVVATSPGAVSASQAKTDSVVAEADRLLERLAEQERWFREQNAQLMEEMALSEQDVDV
jgi:nuclear mRNA export protein SAC3